VGGVISGPEPHSTDGGKSPAAVGVHAVRTSKADSDGSWSGVSRTTVHGDVQEV